MKIENPNGWEFEPGNMVELHNQVGGFVKFCPDKIFHRSFKKKIYFLLNKMNVLRLDYQIYPSYGEFKINK